MAITISFSFFLVDFFCKTSSKTPAKLFLIGTVTIFFFDTCYSVINDLSFHQNGYMFF